MLLNGENEPSNVEASINVSEPDTTFKLLTTAVVPIIAKPTLTAPLRSADGSSLTLFKSTLPSADFTAVV